MKNFSKLQRNKIKLSLTNIKLLKKNRYDKEYIPNTETKFLIHGFGDNGETSGLIETKNEILKTVY